MNYTLTKQLHRKKGIDIWVLRFTDNIDDFAAMKRKMKELKPSAYYSSFPDARGFVFSVEPPKQMLEEQGWTEISSDGKPTSGGGVNKNWWEMIKSGTVRRNSRWVNMIFEQATDIDGYVDSFTGNGFESPKSLEEVKKRANLLREQYLDSSSAKIAKRKDDAFDLHFHLNRFYTIYVSPARAERFKEQAPAEPIMDEADQYHRAAEKNMQSLKNEVKSSVPMGASQTTIYNKMLSEIATGIYGDFDDSEVNALSNEIARELSIPKESPAAEKAVVKNVSDYVYSVDGVKYDLEDLVLPAGHPLLVTDPLSPQWNSSLIELIDEGKVQPLVEGLETPVASPAAPKESDLLKNYIRTNSDVDDLVKSLLGENYRVEMENDRYASLLYSENIILSEVIGTFDTENELVFEETWKEAEKVEKLTAVRYALMYDFYMTINKPSKAKRFDVDGKEDKKETQSPAKLKEVQEFKDYVNSNGKFIRERVQDFGDYGVAINNDSLDIFEGIHFTPENIKLIGRVDLFTEEVEVFTNDFQLDRIIDAVYGIVKNLFKLRVEPVAENVKEAMKPTPAPEEKSIDLGRLRHLLLRSQDLPKATRFTLEGGQLIIELGSQKWVVTASGGFLKANEKNEFAGMFMVKIQPSTLLTFSSFKKELKPVLEAIKVESNSEPKEEIPLPSPAEAVKPISAKKVAPEEINLDPDSYKNQKALNDAIRQFVASTMERQLNEFTDAEKEFIYKYEGAGGLIQQGEQGKGILTEFYTPQLLIRKMWALAYKFGFSGGKILENSVGVGRFLDYVNYSRDNVVAYEIEEVSARICQIIHPDTDVRMVNTFAEHFYGKGQMRSIFNANYEKDFDLVIGNPPYGEYKDLKMASEEKVTKIKFRQLEFYFTIRGLDCLRSGGLLVYVVPANLFNSTDYGKIEQAIEDRAELLDAYLLPDGTFANTDVATCVIVLRKK